MPDDFKQTVDLREQMEKRKKFAAQAPLKKAATPLEKIYREETKAPEKDLRKINQPKIARPRPELVKFGIFILAFLIIGFTVYNLFLKDRGWFNRADKTPVWYAVKLVNDEVFYGQISDTTADPVVIKNVYYNYEKTKEKTGSKPADETGSLILVKRGKETHGPDGTMDIIRSQVRLMEPLNSDSKVLKAILEYEK